MGLMQILDYSIENHRRNNDLSLIEKMYINKISENFLRQKKETTFIHLLFH